MPLPEHPECIVSGDGFRRSPNADVRCLQMPQGAIAYIHENHVSATLADHVLGGTLAIQYFILFKRGDRVVRVYDHDPFSFAKM
ncbi:MAG: hypothetical protein ABSC77_12180 [Terracidiphilus sp.]